MTSPISSTSQTDKSPLRLLWIASAWAFVVAAGAGVLFRWGMVGGFGEVLTAAHIRHGHSHLMLMGWATPALMALMAARWPGQGGRRIDRSVCLVGWTAWVLAFLSFPAFLIWGYQSVPVGSADLPIAAILSGLAIFSWYGFAAVYFGAHRGVKRTPAMRLWDLAVVALVVSSAGAWGVAGLMMAGVDSALWESVTVHFFVDLFGGGWLVLGALGVIRSYVKYGDSTNQQVGRWLVGASVAFVFLIGLPRSYVDEGWFVLGSMAAGLLAAGLFLVIQPIWHHLDRWWWRVGLFFAATVAMLAALAIPPLAEWGLRAGLRLFYLHWVFAGVVTMALVVGAYREWGARAVNTPWSWLAAVAALLLTMLPMTGLWPAELGGIWTVYCVLVGAVAATVIVTAELIGLLGARFAERSSR